MSRLAVVAKEPALTGARRALSDHLELIADAKRLSAHTREPIDRLRGELDRQRGELSDARSALAALEASESDAVREWAERGDERAPRPAPRAADRAPIEEKVRYAEAAAASIETALAGMEPKVFEAAARLASLEQEIPQLILAVLVEQHAVELDAVVRAREALAAAQARMFGLQEHVAARGRELVDGKAPDEVWRAWLTTATKLREAYAATDDPLPPVMSVVTTCKDEWAGVARRLGTDPTSA